ncbi:MAG: hypothetical protein AAF456_16365 [Planctomycetota bacterium]
MNQPSAVAGRTQSDNLENDFINIVEADEHKNELTYELVEACSKNFSKPVLFRKLAPLADDVQTRAFLEVDTDQKLLWREKEDDKAVAFRDETGKTDYNYVQGREGTAAEYLDEIFENNKDVYAHLGRVSSGFKDLNKFPWGMTIFEHLHDTVFAKDWFKIPQWELSGHSFIGNNTGMYDEPGKGAPGSDWHMFPTLNLFVMISGGKQWMTSPPRQGDQFRNQEEIVFPSGGRENPVDDLTFDTVYLESGDVLLNMPYEWHKVLNRKGPSVGAAFRIIDRPYVESIKDYPAVKANLKLKNINDEYAHLLTSLKYASMDKERMMMSLNNSEMMICTAARFNPS